MLGQSWVADHLTRWQDYWSPGGIGWIGDASLVVQIEAAKGKCLDVQGSGKTNGTPVQIYTCNGSAAEVAAVGCIRRRLRPDERQRAEAWT